MRLASIALVAFLTAASTGCSALDRVNDALYETGAFDIEPSAARSAPECGVTVVSGDRRGRGAIVGKDRVLTVAHVIGDANDIEVGTSSLAWTRARVVERIPAQPEDVIVLEVATGKGTFAFEGFAEDRTAQKGQGAPALVLAATGAHGWNHSNALRPGDSGSPVLDGDGALVGLLVGKTRDGAGVLASPGPRPSTSVEVIARLSAGN